MVTLILALIAPPTEYAGPIRRPCEVRPPERVQVFDRTTDGRKLATPAGIGETSDKPPRKP